MALWCITFVGLATASLWPQPSTYTTGAVSIELEKTLTLRTLSSSSILSHAFDRCKQNIFHTADLERKIALHQPSTPIRSTRSISVLDVAISSSDESLQFGVDESYTLDISQTSLAIAATTVFGAVHALETLSQLAIVNVVGQQLSVHIEDTPVSISDRPRFSHRGVLIDTSRNFFPIRDIKRTLDGMSYSKLNVLHWHITDSQSFPIQSIAFPALSEKGAYSPAEVYSQADVADVISYAKARGIRVMPEFDSPGHTTSWGKGIPDLTVCDDMQPDWSTYCNEPPCGQLDPTKESTYKVLAGLIKEMAALFPDNFFHTGADEVNFKCWESDSEIADYLHTHGLQPVDLLAMFQNRTWGIVGDSAKTSVVWEESITSFKLNVPKEVVMQVWLGADSVKPIAEAGYRVIASPYTAWYLDCGTGSWISGGTSWCDPYKTWEHIYAYEPTTNVSQAAWDNIIGGEVCAWSETISPENLDTKLWPRASAAAERLWSAQSLTDPKAAKKRFFDHRQLLVRRGLQATPLVPQWCLLHPGHCE